MRVVFDLMSDAEWHFDDACTPEHALAQVYCEAEGMLSWYYGHLPDFSVAHKSLRFIYGHNCMGLGDFATRLEN